MTQFPLELALNEVLRDIEIQEGETPLEGARWCLSRAEGAGLACRFEPGLLAGAEWLCLDLYTDSPVLTGYLLEFQEGEGGPCASVRLNLLGGAGARLRIPLEVLNQNRVTLPREGALLKPRVGGEVLDRARVDRVRFINRSRGGASLRWCMTAPVLSVREPPRLEKPVLPEGQLLDRFGQSTRHDWPARMRSEDELVRHLRSELAAAKDAKWPDGCSKWGGWAERCFDSTGFFRTLHDGRRWWLVDPDGCAFWSAGIDCVRAQIQLNCAGLEDALEWIPPTEGEFAECRYEIVRNGQRRAGINYLCANLVRAFGGEDWHRSWSQMVLGQIKRVGFNTVANWSEWEIAREAGFPYVRPLDLAAISKAKMVFRDMPDVFAPEFESAAREYARQLEDTRDDPAMIGYFLMNEPNWGFAALSPAQGMLVNTESCASRQQLADWLQEKYGNEAKLAAAWGMEVSLEKVASGRWPGRFSEVARGDLVAFSTLMIGRFFEMLNAACRRVDSDHLNLGARYHTVPPEWIMRGMRGFDVFSINCYKEKVPADSVETIVREMGCPVMIGEWHFGALDVGLPGTGIGHVASQADRGRAYRVYLEDAAAQPGCVGVHWFTLYDQSALGRFDGENYQIGFFDVCGRAYTPLAEAARAAHERAYRLADGQLEPFGEAPEYLVRLF